MGCCKPFGTALGVGGVGLAVLAFGLALILMVPGIMRDQIIANTQLEPDKMVFELWRDVPVPFFLSAYFFDVQNPTEILGGGKPKLVQRGPYVYRERRQKTNITIHNNDTISFLEYRQFHFVPHMSNGSEEDYIVVPNMLVLGAAVMLEGLPLPVKLTVSSTFALFGESAFMNRTVGEIMWGYDSRLLDFLNTVKPGLFPFKGKFGLFADLNNTDMGLFNVFSGMQNISRVHMVDSWNGMKKVSYWNSDQCNMINGTAGQIWPPFMTSSSPVEFYSPDVCRSVKLEYADTRDYRGIPTFRYVAPKTLFANGTDYPPNEGFCPCRQSGIQNVSSCRLNAPMFVSQPHFLNGDPSLVDAVDGLHPSEDQHGLFLDLHPLTGIPMNCSIKLQLSLFIKRVPGILQTGVTKPVVLPLLWFEETGYLDDPLYTMFYTTLVLIPKILEYGQYVLVVIGACLFLIGVLLILRSKTLNDGSVAIWTPFATKFGSSNAHKYQGPQRETHLEREKPNPPNGPPQDSEVAPLLGEEPGTVSDT